MKHEVLDHGYVLYVDHMGTDADIVKAARVSYAGDVGHTSDDIKDRRLIRRLMHDHHTSPFEMCELKLEMKMPIFVARQWVRHRTASLNEISARYTVVDDEMFLPEEWAKQSTDNKQGRSDEVIDNNAYYNGAASYVHEAAFAAYNKLLKHSVSRELARTVLPVATYTRWVWKMDLHNLLHLLKLRTDPHAQFETREYANAIYMICQELWPITMEAFNDYVMGAYTLTRHEIDIVKLLIKGVDDREGRQNREKVMKNLRRIYVDGGKMTDTEFTQFRKRFEI